ncbi:hypothetical protein OS493_009701 [Desmophyllum pertusum]|uniref:Uncharacterized protein n=1 Tax=Desmophyllum pertusum TaxID=174260 RepID=A0A9W9YU05_9CNID|nr:hypothetical protein OS493_009701 [Desmophyllum pertusum]
METLLHCDGDGQFYQVKACRYVKQPFQRKQFKDRLPETKPKLISTERTVPKPVTYAPPRTCSSVYS